MYIFKRKGHTDIVLIRLRGGNQYANWIRYRWEETVRRMRRRPVAIALKKEEREVIAIRRIR